MWKCGRSWNLVPLPTSNTKGGKRGMLEVPRMRLGRETIILLHGPASKTNHKLVRTHFAPFWCWDKPRATLDSLDSPWPGLGGSHHLPPYSILCVTPQRLHTNDTFSRDSQRGVPKLSRVGLPGLWASITSCSDLQMG
jgi:hypothetical protein